MQPTHKKETKSVCILYGFCEGPRVGVRFRNMIEAKGYKIIANPAEADIIIGHSGGCFLVPANIKAKQIIQIGIPYWPGRAVASSIGRKLITDLQHHRTVNQIPFWLYKTFWNLVYFWNMPRNMRMLRGRAQGVLWKYGTITTTVRPKFDTISTPDVALLPFVGKPTHVEIAAYHDQCWLEPKPYIDLL